MYQDPTLNTLFTLGKDVGWSLNQPDIRPWCETIFCGPHPLHAQTAGSLSKLKMKNNFLWYNLYKGFKYFIEVIKVWSH